MRANDVGLQITPYAEFNQIDTTKIKIKEPNHLFDIDPNNRKSNKRTYVDRDATQTNVENREFLSKKIKNNRFVFRHPNHQLNPLEVMKIYRAIKNQVQQLHN